LKKINNGYLYIRDDKDSANTLEEIKEIEAMAKGLA